MEPLQLTDLPWHDVIFRAIFPHLSTVDLCRLRGVSHEFLQLFTEYMGICKKLDFSGTIMSNEVFQKITMHCKSLCWLSVSKCSWVQDSSLVPLFSNNRSLSHVDMSRCMNLSGASLQSLVVNCKKLSALYLADVPWLTRGGWQVIILHLSKLQRIDVEGCWELEDDDFRKFFKKFPEMKEVRFAKVESVSDQTLYHIAHSCPALEVLNVSHCWRISDTGIKQVVEYCKHLKELNVEGCRDVSEPYLCNLYLKNIKIKSSHALPNIIKRRRLCGNLGINVQI